jgi:hypothetical protein
VDGEGGYGYYEARGVEEFLELVGGTKITK